MEKQRLDNLLGALSLTLMDRVNHAVRERTGLHDSSIFALVLLGQANSSLTIDALAKLLWIAHSSGVRLVERLVDEGYVERKSGSDKRTVVLALTRAGRKIVDAALASREAAISNITNCLPETMHETMTEACERLLTEMSGDRITAARNCRLCDERACDLKRCPVDIAYHKHADTGGGCIHTKFNNGK